MKLLLDIGNSRLKWALLGENSARRGAVPHAGDPLAAFAALPADLAHPDSVWIANVTGEALGQAVADKVRDRWQRTPRFAAVRAALDGLVVAYREPARLGVDRWLAMLALWNESRGPFVVAGCGTALTFDAVDAQGRHLGGVIAPGLMTAQTAVLGATRFAAGQATAHFDDGLGTDTEACVRQGALHACAGLVERLARRHAPPPARRVLTGGDGALLQARIDGAWQLREDLVESGLLVLARISPAAV